MVTFLPDKDGRSVPERRRSGIERSLWGKETSRHVEPAPELEKWGELSESANRLMLHLRPAICHSLATINTTSRAICRQLIDDHRAFCRLGTEHHPLLALFATSNSNDMCHLPLAASRSPRMPFCGVSATLVVLLLYFNAIFHFPAAQILPAVCRCRACPTVGPSTASSLFFLSTHQCHGYKPLAMRASNAVTRHVPCHMPVIALPLPGACPLHLHTCPPDLQKNPHELRRTAALESN
ncbi:hypothetical protein EDB86DRAFT_2996090 [Lactarius hatsudake]|nr:hypothetical protein EDB86DRAFT_2996090 [Lactarius hatsudake]